MEKVEFSILDNRYLYLTKEKTQDNFDGLNKSKGRWDFDVRHIELGGGEDSAQTIYTGVILFENNITDSGGTEILPS